MCETQAMAERVRVAYTVMQSWHRVPGGTATSVLSLARALGERDDVDVVGCPPIPVRRLPGPYQAIYEAWNRGLLPPTLAVGDVDVVHATTVMVPPKGKARGLVATVHDLFP